jgi:hypothetical protein
LFHKNLKVMMRWAARTAARRHIIKKWGWMKQLQADIAAGAA